MPGTNPSWGVSVLERGMRIISFMMPRVLVSLKTIERSVVMLSRASIPGPSGKVYLLVGLQERVYSVYQEVSGFH